MTVRKLLLGAVIPVAMAVVLDRIAVVVGNDVITESEVNEEVRMTEFLNGQALKVGPAERRAAAERLVDQQLIRNEIRIGGYPEPKEPAVDATLEQFRNQRFAGSDAAMRASLQAYGLTESDLKTHLRRQLAALLFTNTRFHVGIPQQPQQSGTATKAASIEQQLDAWLKEKRENTKIRFVKEALE